MKTKTQFTSRILSLVLAVAMVIGLLPMTSFTASAANISTSSSAIQKGHYIYFGSNGQKWRVLDASKTSMGTDGMFLFSENSLGTASIGTTAQNYMTNGLEAWCTNYYNGTNFTAAEKTVMLATTVAQSTGTYDGETGTNYALDGDYLFLLSAAEAANSAYFADDEARVLDHSKFQSNVWFLRTDNNSGTKGQIFSVSALGRIIDAPIRSDGGNGEKWSYRPGFNLDTSKLLFVTAATNGKSDGLSTISISGSEWKLTLKDSNSFTNGASISKTTLCAGQSVTVTHTALSDISTDYTNVTAAIFSGDTMLYYGSVNTDTFATSSTVILPADLAAGSYTLKFYGEDWNGDKRTDIATGTPYSVNITIKNHTGGSATCIAKAICTSCGNEYGNYSDHSYQYTVSDSTIIETCRNGCDHRATATLNADGAYIYTGSTITPATIDYSDNWQGEKPTDISYVNNVDVGTATATITVEGQTLTKNFQIKNAYSVSFNANGGSGARGSETIADGEEYMLPANPFTAPSGYQFKGWATSQNGNVLQDEKITVSENVTLYAIWEKIPAEMPTVAVSENLTLTYGEYTGQKFTATVEKKDGYTYKYQWIDGNTVISNTDTLEIPDDLAAGVYDYYLAVGAKRTDNEEITWYTNRNLLVKVNPKELDASNITLNQDIFTYDGKEQIPTVTVKVGGKTLTENTDYDVILPSDCKNAGTKTIKVFFRGNYSGSAQVDYEIKRKEIGIYWGATEFIPYTGELIVPQATATSLADGDVCTLTTSVVETTEGAGIVPGRWHAKVTSLSNDNYCLPASGNLVEVEYGIVKGNIAAPVVSSIDETIKGKADGKINGLTTEMEYATEYTADDDKYTKVTDANMTFAPGTYYVRYQAAGYYNASPFKEVVIKEGGLLSVTIPQTQTGYTIATEDTELVWNGSTTLSFTLKDGYSKTGAFAVKVNETPIALDANDQYVITNAQENIEITVEGVADITPPTAEIKVKENNWTSFLNDITFGLFFKETQDVTITASDIGSGVKSIQYYLSNGKLELDEVKAITDWADYNGTFKIDPNNYYVVYAKITDNAGNILYINSDGIVLDNIAPTLEGIENGKTYYGDLTVIKSDEQFYDIKTVTLDGEPMGFAEGTYGLIPADNAEHIVVVEDHAGNKTTYTVTVMKNYTVTYKADGVVVDTLTVGHGKDATPPAVPAKAGYTSKWDHDGKRITSDIVINAVYTENSASAPSDSQSPQTGDNSHMMLWIALLLISGGALITLTVVDRKRRMASKR